MRRTIPILIILLLLNAGIAYAHRATYQIQRIGENTVSITVFAGSEQTKGIEIRSYTVRNGNTININYGYSKNGQTEDTVKIDARTVLLPAMIVLTNVDEEQTAVFPDIEGISNQEYITHLHDAGIIEGRPDGTYRPYDAISRAEFVTIITKAIGVDLSQKPQELRQFSDTRNHWAEDRIIAAANMGIINGLPDGSFRPDDPISVAEAGAIICRTFGITNIGDENYEKLNNSHWAYEYMTAVFGTNIIRNGDDIYNNFEEDAPINRADCAMLVSRGLIIGRKQ